MATTVNFGHIESLSDDRLRRETYAILGKIERSKSDTGGLHTQILAEQLLMACHERGILLDVQARFEDTYDTELRVGSVLQAEDR